MKLLVIGEICLDVFVQCEIKRLCPEAPVPVLNPISRTDNYGMAGNVVANLKSLAGNMAGEFKVDTLTPLNTIIKTRYVDRQTGYIVCRVDEHDKVEQIDIEFARGLEGYDGIVISDYHKGYLDERDIEAVAKWSHKLGIPVFLDTKKDLGEWSRLVTFVKINEKEFNRQPHDPVYNCQNMIVTMGPNGSMWANKGYICPVDQIQVADVSGAGDTYLAAFALEYCRMYKNLGEINAITQAMFHANRAARIAVSKRGVVAVKWDEL